MAQRDDLMIYIGIGCIGGERRYVGKVLGLGQCTSVMYVGCMNDMICTSDSTRGCAYVKSVWC